MTSRLNRPSGGPAVLYRAGDDPAMPRGTRFLRSDAAGPFHCELEPERSHVIVRPVGELDIATAGHLEEHLRDLRALRFEHLTLDLGRLTFIDSTGIRLLIVWTADARAEGWTLKLLPGSPSISRVLDITGVRETLFRTGLSAFEGESPREPRDRPLRLKP
jgi:anti-sigma B factor antagonist